MKTFLKKLSLNGAGFVAYVGAPLIPVIKYWGFFTETSGGTAVSLAAVLALVAGLPVLTYVFRNIKMKVGVNSLWLVIAAVSTLFYFVSKQIMVVSLWGVGGSVAGSLCFRTADKVAEKATTAKTTEKIIATLKSELNNGTENK